MTTLFFIAGAALISLMALWIGVVLFAALAPRDPNKWDAPAADPVAPPLAPLARPEAEKIETLPLTT